MLVVAGREDYQIGLAPQQELAEHLPNGRLLVIQNAGHFPHVDAPAVFARAVIGFFREEH